MDKMIRKLYINYVQDIHPADATYKELMQELIKILEEDEEDLGSPAYEKYRDKAFRIASAAEESGFVRGFKYALRLMMECSQK